MTVNPVAFYLIAAAVVAGALAVVMLPTILHAAYALIACFFMVGVLYLAVGADFLAVSQVLVYAGAIPVLIIFAVMLTRGSMSRAGNGWVRWWPLSALAALGFAAVAVAVFVSSRSDWRLGVYPQSLLDGGTTGTLGQILLNRFALPFEAASVLLLVALVGAVLLARRDQAEEAMERADEERRRRQERIVRRREERERARVQRGGGGVAVRSEDVE